MIAVNEFAIITPQVIYVEAGSPKIKIIIPEIIKITIKKLKIGAKYTFQIDFLIFGSSLKPYSLVLSSISSCFNPTSTFVFKSIEIFSVE